MELFALNSANGLSIGKKILPMKFKDVLSSGALEKDLEDLIVDRPGLLNWSDASSFDIPDLLIISRQPRTVTRKRADLFAISSMAELVIIEIKRDADDEKSRREGMEFQAIRYAAASRKMTAAAIIEMYTEYLRNIAKAIAGTNALSNSHFRIEAIDKLCKHIADEDEDLTEDDLEELLDPKEKQKIYLVAAGYEPDVLSACAWLRAHEIDIACFQLRPYKVSDQILLERERLIPPPQLDDFLVEMRPVADNQSSNTGGSISRTSSDKAQLLKWSDDLAEQPITTWREALIEGTKKAVKLGLSPADLPMKNCADAATSETFQNAFPIDQGLFIETHASSESIRSWLSKMFLKIGKPNGFLQIVTKSGKTIDLPETDSP